MFKCPVYARTRSIILSRILFVEGVGTIFKNNVLYILIKKTSYCYKDTRGALLLIVRIGTSVSSRAVGTSD